MSEHLAETSGHETFYLAEGPEDGPLVIFCHGWQLLSLSWRHRLSCLASLGFRAVAPDMRGYGRSTVDERQEAVLSEGDLEAYASALGRNGFFGSCSWYVNSAANGDHALRAANGGRIDLPPTPRGAVPTANIAQSAMW